MSRAVTTKERLEFIERVHKYAIKAYKTLGKVKPSVCIAMMIVESATGTSKYAQPPYNSYLGQKRGTGKTATKYWNGKSFSARTQECYDQNSGKLTTIKDTFRCYDSVEQCIFNYYELLNTSLYKGVTDCAPWDQIQQIKNCGYFTSTTEVNTVRTLIKQYELERFDTMEYESNEGTATSGDGVKIDGVVDLCNYVGIDSSFDSRKRLAEKFGMINYKGTAEQNEELMRMIAERCMSAANKVLRGYYYGLL